MKRLLTGIVTVVAAFVFFSSPAFAAVCSPYTSGSTGVDISFPDCNATIPQAAFGIVGVTGGIAYNTNSCAAEEASHFQNYSLYINTGLNASSSSSYYVAAEQGCNGDARCAAYHYGYNAGIKGFQYAQSLGLSSKIWWLDVETANTWNADVTLDQQSLQGEHDALIASGVQMVGVYSTTYQWQYITGDPTTNTGWKNYWPGWGATQLPNAQQAQQYCTGHEFTGGPTWLIQYQDPQSHVDQDVAC
jgi:hypothetical protein